MEVAIRTQPLLLLALVAIAGACASMTAAEPGPGGGAPGPSEPDRPDGHWGDLEPQIEEAMASASIPGLAVAVTRPGEVLWTGAFGVADIEAERPVGLDTPFMLASVSKTVTAVAVMDAIEAGFLDLDQEVDIELPFEVDNPQVPDEVIQLRHLVSHTSGIRDNWSNMPCAEGDSPYGLAEYLEGYLVQGGRWYSAADNFHAYRPGAEWSYGNVATALAGYMVEVATGRPFDDYCDSRIFTALGMQDTGWHLSDFDVSTVAMPHVFQDGAPVAHGHYGYPDYPDGQLRSSIQDVASFLAAVSYEGEPASDGLLEPETRAGLFSPPVPDVRADQYVFWYGLEIAGRTVIGHNGSDIGVATELGFSPESGVGVVVLMNTGWASARDAATEIQGLLFERAELLED